MQKKIEIPFEVNNSKGITLISLVITIAVILILTSVTVKIAIGDGGLIQNAKDAKNEQQIEMYKTKIKILVTNWNLRKQIDDAVNINDLWEELKEENIIKDQVSDVKQNGNENYIITTPDGYEIEININEYSEESEEL